MSSCIDKTFDGTFPQRKTSLLSTEGMLRHIANSPAREFAVGTELGILHSMRHQFPDKDFYSVNPSPVCAFMKTITLDGILRALETMSPQARVPEAVAQKGDDLPFLWVNLENTISGKDLYPINELRPFPNENVEPANERKIRFPPPCRSRTNARHPRRYKRGKLR